VDVLITDKGQKLLKKLDAGADPIAEIMGQLPENDAEMLSNLLDKLRKSE
jgi:MarR family 2-MHQ and catechol resistance regulon transcriptional repressor